MADQDKKIKFKFDFDETSFSKIKMHIEQLTKSLQELAKAANSINMGGGGGIAAGGPNLGSMLGISSGKQQPGMPGMAQMAKPTNVAGVLTQGLVADRNLFKNVADGSRDALRTMKDALRDTVTEQTRDIARLKKEIDGLASSYNKLKDGEFTKDIAQGDFKAMIGKQRELQNIASARGQNQQTLGMGGVSMGGLMGAAGAVGGAIGAIGGAWQQGADLYYANRQASLNEVYRGPLDNVLQRGQVMSAFGQTALGIRGGDVGLAMGAIQWSRNREVRNDLGAIGRRARKELVEMQAGYTMDPSGFKRGVGDAIGETLGGTGQSVSALKLKNMLNDIPVSQAQQAQEAMQAYANSDSLLRARANEFYAGAMGKFGLQRAVGMSSVDRQGKWHDVAARFEARALEQGIDPGQLAGAIDAAKYTVGYGNRFKGQGFLNRQFGGFANAGQVYAAGQEFGSGSALVNAFAGRGGIAGRGGLDPLASSRLADTVMGQMYGSRYGAVQGEGLAGALGGLANMGGDIGSQLRLARGAGAGLQNLGQSLSGATDPLQQAINAYAGADVFGGKFYQMNAMTQLSGGDLIEALRTGNVPERLKDLGISMPQIRDYAAKRNQFGLARYQMGQGGSDMDSLVSSARSAGGPQAFIRSQLQGLKGNEKNTKFFQLTRQLGGAIAASTGGSSEEAIRGLQVELAADEGITGITKGRGVGDPTSRKGLEQAALDPQAEKKKKDAEELEKNESKLRNAFTVMGQLPDKLAEVGTGLLAGEARLTQSLGNLAYFIDSKVLHNFKGTRSDYDKALDQPPPKAAPKEASRKEAESIQNHANRTIRTAR